MSAVIDRLTRQHQEVLARIERDQAHFADPEAAGEFLNFLMRDVVAHFRLEEDALFPKLAGIPSIAQGPLRVMEAEHGTFRHLLNAGNEARDRGDGRSVCSAASDLAALLQGHIAKEDRVLFPMALETLSEEELRGIDAAGAAM